MTQFGAKPWTHRALTGLSVALSRDNIQSALIRLKVINPIRRCIPPPRISQQPDAFFCYQQNLLSRLDSKRSYYENKERFKRNGEITRLFSRASSLCSSLALKQLEHLFLLNMLGANLRQSDFDISVNYLPQIFETFLSTAYGEDPHNSLQFSRV